MYDIYFKQYIYMYMHNICYISRVFIPKFFYIIFYVVTIFYIVFKLKTCELLCVAKKKNICRYIYIWSI